MGALVVPRNGTAPGARIEAREEGLIERLVGQDARCERRRGEYQQRYGYALDVPFSEGAQPADRSVAYQQRGSATDMNQISWPYGL